MQVDNDIVVLKEMSLRTSEGINSDDITIIIPTSKIINEKVINWSHQEKKTRFRIDIGIAYGSDVDLVIKILEESAYEHFDVFNLMYDGFADRVLFFPASSAVFYGL